MAVKFVWKLSIINLYFEAFKAITKNNTQKCNHVTVSYKNKLYFKRVYEMVMQLTQLGLYETN